MLRPNKKARDIVFDILGIPPALQSNRSKKKKEDRIERGQPLQIPRLIG